MVSACLLRSSSLDKTAFEEHGSLISTDITTAPMIAHAMPTMSRAYGMSCKKIVARTVWTTHCDYTMALAGPASPKVAE